MLTAAEAFLRLTTLEQIIENLDYLQAKKMMSESRLSLIGLISTLFIELSSGCIDISIDFFQEGNQTLLELAHHGREGAIETILTPQ